MKRRAVASVLIVLAGLLVATADEGQAGGLTVGPDVGAGGESEEEEAEERGATEPEPAGSDQFFTAQRLYPFTRPLSLDSAYRAAQDQARGQLARRDLARPEQAGAVAVAAAWQPLGPSNIGGRVTDIVVDPVRANTVYVGAATGGV